MYRFLRLDFSRRRLLQGSESRHGKKEAVVPHSYFSKEETNLSSLDISRLLVALPNRRLVQRKVGVEDLAHLEEEEELPTAILRVQRVLEARHDREVCPTLIGLIPEELPVEQKADTIQARAVGVRRQRLRRRPTTTTPRLCPDTTPHLPLSVVSRAFFS